jgi:hypothetical protein
MIPSGRLSLTQRIMAEHLRIIAVAPFFGTIPTVVMLVLQRGTGQPGLLHPTHCPRELGAVRAEQ